MTNTITMPRSVVEQALQSLHLGIAMYPNGGTAAVAIQATIDALRAALDQPQVNSPEIPEGWRLVPVEPTDDMLYDIQEYSHILPPRGKRIWAHMLAAAPQPPAVEQPQGEQQTRYLAGGARYKVTHLAFAGYCIHGLPREMLGQWVAFVDATDNKHMDSRQPQSVTDCHQLQPQGEQEPVAWIENIGGGVSYNPYHEAARKLPDGVRFDLYTHPQPKREPQGDSND